jgi:nitroreductase
MFELLRWAAYLKEWKGPSPDERPTSYIIILGDKQFTKYHSVDAGIASQSILLSAVEKGLGGCIFASGDKERIREEFEISDDYEILMVIAIGKPKEEIVLTEIEEGADIKYWRDELSVHYVPKRKLDDVIYNVFSD